MKHKIVLGTVAVCLVAVVIAMLNINLGQQREELNKQLPWYVESTDDGSIQVFGIRLGHSTIMEAERRLQAAAEISLFVSATDEYVTEGYMDQVNLAGLRAKVVLALAVPQQELQEMYQRGLRISTLGGGKHKVTLHPDDLKHVRNAPVNTLTYLPQIQLDPQLITKRFGEPAQRIRDPGGDVVHWLYPAIGLDIALSDKNKGIFQYMPPKEFSARMAPLIEQGAILP